MTSTYRRNPQIEESPLQGELMLFDPVKSSFFVLNQTMAHVWHQCDGATGIDNLLQSVQHSFAGAESGRVATEVKSALDELLALGLVLENQ